MVHGMQIAAIRSIVLSLAVIAQIYLFVHIRLAIRSLPLSSRLKSCAVVLVGAAILLLFAANRYLMFSPVAQLGAPKEAEEVLAYASAVWTFGSILSALLLFFIHSARRLGRTAVRILRSVRRSEPSDTDPGRRRFLQAGLNGIAAAPFVFSGYGAVFTSKAFEVRELALSFGSPLRVVQLSDIHAGVYMTRDEIRRLADMVIALQPDLFALTGDFISTSMKSLPGCIEEMARVRARYGTFATLGNHEHWYGDLSEIRSVFSQYGIPLLVNTHEVIRSSRDAFAVAGIDDLRSGSPDLAAALHGLDSGMPTLLLSHRPEIFPEAAARGIALTLAGHYHGGQIKLGLPTGGVSVADLVTPYPEGLYRLDDSNLYVSRGIGTTFTPVRLNVPPEITLLHLGS
jgi:predicted MPP superfamily phosphohydrolase